MQQQKYLKEAYELYGEVGLLTLISEGGRIDS
jgi:hypothetical protein